MSAPPGIAYIGQKFVPIEEAKISVLDWGFLHSDATYDVAHVWKGRFFRLGDHLDRFLASASRLRLSPAVDRAGLARILAECVARSGLADAYVEMILTRGVSPTFSRDPRDAENRLICFAIPFAWILRPEQRETGLSVAISHIQRIPPESVDPRVKNYHWLDFVMGLYDAYDRGAGSVVLRDASGNLTEGPGFNIFIVKNGTIATPGRGCSRGSPGDRFWNSPGSSASRWRSDPSRPGRRPPPTRCSPRPPPAGSCRSPASTTPPWPTGAWAR